MKDRQLKNLQSLIEKVKEENKNQISKWDIQDRTRFEWFIYLAEEVGELAEAISEEHYREGCPDDVVEEAIQVATLSLKIAEMYMGDVDDN